MYLLFYLCSDSHIKKVFTTYSPTFSKITILASSCLYRDPILSDYLSIHWFSFFLSWNIQCDTKCKHHCDLNIVNIITLVAFYVSNSSWNNQVIGYIFSIQYKIRYHHYAIKVRLWKHILMILSLFWPFQNWLSVLQCLICFDLCYSHKYVHQQIKDKTSNFHCPHSDSSQPL